MSRDDHSIGATLPSPDSGEVEQAQSKASYLLVFERDSSWIFELPFHGRTLIGRGEGAELRLQDPSISRHHAKITSTSQEVSLSDLDSQNGTYLNGERLANARTLHSGDAFTVGNVTLVFHSRGYEQDVRRPVDFAYLGQRLEEECERAQRRSRPCSLVAIDFGRADVDRPAVSIAIEPCLHRIDVAAWDGPAGLYILFAETDAEQVLQRTERLKRELLPFANAMRLGVASCPGDGCTADALLMSARAAVRAGSPGQVERAATAFQSRVIDGQEILVADPAMIRVYELVERLAAVEISVLISGETGAGKELIARALHHWSARRERPMVALNCATIPEQLVESELFGYEKGAFSGAATSKPGLFEVADGGTMFLDEVGEMPAAVQAKLLRVLETGRLVRVGGLEERRVDLRIVAATLRNLSQEVAARRFREDLFFRLRGATVWVPPLRDRPRELAILAQRFLMDACARSGRNPMKITDEAMQRLAQYRWPGNVRELKSFVEFVVAVERGPELTPEHLFTWFDSRGASEHGPLAASDESNGGATPALAASAVRPNPAEPRTAAGTQAPRFRPIEEELRDLERTRMVEALTVAGGNQTRAAELIHMPRRTFATKLRLYNLAGVGKP